MNLLILPITYILLKNIHFHSKNILVITSYNILPYTQITMHSNPKVARFHAKIYENFANDLATNMKALKLSLQASICKNLNRFLEFA